jgi:hypothetical protein
MIHPETAHTGWRKGPPPHVGWWLCVYAKHSENEAWRWWNGTVWSAPVFDHCHPELLGVWASKPAIALDAYIFWSDYYPENPRVLRVDPQENA